MEGNVLFNDPLNTFYLRLYGVGSSEWIQDIKQFSVLSGVANRQYQCYTIQHIIVKPH